jgi:hypothetical protein
VLYSFGVGFLVYFALAKAGLQPEAIDAGGEPTGANMAGAMRV